MPTHVTGLPPVEQIAVGWFTSSALTSDGTLWFFGNSGNQASTDTSGGWQTIAAGLAVNCGIKTDGTLWCWGTNDAGQCGQGTIAPKYGYAPLGQVGVDSDWAQVAPGNASTCARKLDGRLFCWGRNQNGELGQGTVGAASPVPVQVPGTWLDVAVGEAYACAIATDHAIWCWGAGPGNDLGPNAKPTPTAIALPGQWMALDAFYQRTCARDVNATLTCFGGYDLLDGVIPTPWTAPGPVDAFAVGGMDLCASSGGIWSCLGANADGQLGQGDTTTRSTLTTICP